MFHYRSAQDVSVYAPSQARAVERSLGYRVVEPTPAVHGATGLGLSQVIVTELDSRKAIHYVYGDLHTHWVLVLETPDAMTRYAYDAQAREVLFASHGRGISVTTNLPKATLNRIVRRLGGPTAPRGHG